MSKYIKLEDAIHAIAENMAQAANLKEHCNEPTFCAGEFLVEGEMSVKDLPTIEVKDGDLDDAVLLTEDAYSDLCLRASQVNEDCVDRYSVLAELNPLSYEYKAIKELPSVVPKGEEPKRGEWIVYPLIDEGRVKLECPICGDTSIRAVDYKPHFCENCGTDMRGDEE